MDIIKSILEKLRIKELLGIIFISCIILTVLPEQLLRNLYLLNLRQQYQSYISLCILIIGAYYILHNSINMRIFLLNKKG